MAIFNVNQNRQFYVINEVVSAEPTKEGQIKLGKTADGKQFFFKHFGKGGLTRTDIIDVDNVCYAKETTKAKMQRKLKKATVTLSKEVNNGLPIAGQDYILRIQINNFFSPGDASVYIKSNAVHATKAMSENAALFYKAMLNSLVKNFSREKQTSGMNLLDFKLAAEDAGIEITEVGNQPWRLGVLSQEAVNFEVIPTTVRYEGEEVVWGDIAYTETETVVGNGKKVADLEYFCMAERGDMFRNMGWPNNIDVKYMVDPTKEYDMLDIHYFFSGSGVQVHKSEKDITIVTDNSTVMTALKSAVTALGITIQ